MLPGESQFLSVLKALRNEGVSVPEATASMLRTEVPMTSNHWSVVSYPRDARLYRTYFPGLNVISPDS